MISLGYACDYCPASDSGYPDELSALRAEIAHLQSPDCPAELAGEVHQALQQKMHDLAELELALRETVP